MSEGAIIGSSTCAKVCQDEAPRSRAAGVEIRAKLGERVEHGHPLLVLHGESRGELAYALAYAEANSDMLQIRPA